MTTSISSSMSSWSAKGLVAGAALPSAYVSIRGILEQSGMIQASERVLSVSTVFVISLSIGFLGGAAIGVIKYLADQYLTPTSSQSQDIELQLSYLG